MLKEYNSLVGYLERKTLLSAGKLHVRFHWIRDIDGTPFFHSHPFSYMSIILSGGYTEMFPDGTEKTHSVGSVIIRDSAIYHRIVAVKPSTLTLFITWKNATNSWSFSDKTDVCSTWQEHIAGVYTRKIFNKTVFCKFDKHWFRGHNTVMQAMLEVRPSIDQRTVGVLVEEI